MFTDFAIHLFIASIHFDAYSRPPQLGSDIFRVRRMPLCNRDHHHLHRREPDRERTRVVLDENAEEALDRSIQSAMHHDRLLARAVFSDVLQAEALREVEVELHSRELPQAADCVHPPDVDLRAVKCRFARDDRVFDLFFFQNLFERIGGSFPLIVAADKILAIIRIPGGKLSLKLIETEILQHIQRKIQASRDFRFDLVRRAENMRVVLSKSAHSQQSVHYPRALVAIDSPEFAQPHRQIAIRLQRILINQDVPRTIHRLQTIFGIVEFHRVEHVLRVVAFVSRGVEELPPSHVRRINERISAPEVLFAHPVFHLLADDPTLRVPENESRPGQFLDRKQVQLLSQHTMIALFGLFDLVQIIVKVFLGKKRSPVNPLQLLIFFIPQPISPGDVQ